jgi:hypothetical protein
MRATKAYIAGLGTTGILITCFLLLLSVGSALIAFEGWPGAASGDGLERVVVKNQAERGAEQSRHRATAERDKVAAGRRGKRGAAPTARGVRRDSVRRAEPSRSVGPTPATDDGSGSGPVAGRPRSGAGDARTSAGGGSKRTQAPARAPDVGNTVEQATGGLGDTVERTTGGLGDTVQEATGGLGDAVGGVSPGLGETVSGTGDAAGQVVDGAGEGVGQVVEDTGRTVNGLLP